MIEKDNLQIKPRPNQRILSVEEKEQQIIMKNRDALNREKLSFLGEIGDQIKKEEINDSQCWEDQDGEVNIHPIQNPPNEC